MTVLYPYRDGKCPIKSVKASADPAANDFTLVLADGGVFEWKKPDTDPPTAL